MNLNRLRYLIFMSMLNVLALVKDSERYVFLYDDPSIPGVLEAIEKYIRDPELEFNEGDALSLYIQMGINKSDSSGNRLEQMF